jgi:hypothetical protein
MTYNPSATAAQQSAAQARYAASPVAQDAAVQAAIAQVRMGIAGPVQRRIIRQARAAGRI